MRKRSAYDNGVFNFTSFKTFWTSLSAVPDDVLYKWFSQTVVARTLGSARA